MDCRVVLAQVEPTLGNVSANLEVHLREIRAAIEAKADIIVFPELSLTGYFLRDQTSEVALALDSGALQEIADFSGRISIAVGFAERGRDGRVYNAMAWYEDGELLELHRKVHLVHYGMFDEARDFAPGERFRAFESKHGRFGLLICEDMWHVGSSWVHFLSNVDALFVASAGPARGVTEDETGLRSMHVWNKIHDTLALLYQTWIVYVNRVGSEDGILFGGGSRVVDPHGRETVAIAGFDPGRVTAHLDSDVLRRARVSTPLRRDEKPWIIARELTRLASGGQPQ
ncbi:MAG: carbon-nitrogen hydrolase [Planctomycetes bacterium]|nr:carbon-nitrogen hydrolase [Planctomycetota bacterium]